MQLLDTVLIKLPVPLKKTQFYQIFWGKKRFFVFFRQNSMTWVKWRGLMRGAMSASPIAAAAAATTFVAPLVLRPTSTAGISYLPHDNRFFIFRKRFPRSPALREYRTEGSLLRAYTIIYFLTCCISLTLYYKQEILGTNATTKKETSPF